MNSRLALTGLLAACVLASCSERSAPAGNAVGSQSSPAAKQTEAPAKNPTPAPASTGAPAAPAPTAPAPAPTSPSATAPTGSAPVSAPATNPAVTPVDEAVKKWFITVERAKEIYDAKQVEGKQVVFIDARTFLEFRDDGHIRGAMHYATAYTRGVPQPKVRNYLPGSAIVIYCHGELCTDSLEVGRYFESLKLDIGPVFIIKAGFPGWKAAYPNLVDKGNEVGFD